MGLYYEAYREGLAHEGRHEVVVAAGAGACLVTAERATEDALQITVTDCADDSELAVITVERRAPELPPEVNESLAASIAEDVCRLLKITAKQARIRSKRGRNS